MLNEFATIHLHSPILKECGSPQESDRQQHRCQSDCDLCIWSSSVCMSVQVSQFSAILDFYKDCSHAPLLLVPSLLTAGICDTKAMVHSLLSPERIQQLATQPHMFELLDQALAHVVASALLLLTKSLTLHPKGRIDHKAGRAAQS